MEDEGCPFPSPPDGDGDDDLRQRVFDRGDETELGIDLADSLGDRINLTYAEGRVWRYDAGAWEGLDPDELTRTAMRYAGRHRWVKTPKGEMVPAPIALKASGVKGIVYLAESELANAEFFNAAPVGAAFAETFARVDEDRLRHERLGRHHRAKRSHVATYAPDTTKRPEAVDRLFAETWAGCSDIETTINYYWEWIGAALCGITTRYKDSPLLIGAKDSGKSRILDVAAAVFPPETVKTVPLQMMADPYYTALLSTGRINIVNELPDKDVHVSEAAKAILSGDAITARHIYGRPFTWRPRCAHIFAANTLPPTPDPALVGRLVVLECPNVVPLAQRDRMLPAKILAEAPQIAGAAMLAAKTLLARGHFIRPQSATEAGETWARDSNPVAAWAAEHLDNNFETTSLADLLTAFNAWAQANHHRPLAPPTLAGRLKALGFKRHKTATCNLWHAELLSPARIAARARGLERVTYPYAVGSSHD